MLKASLTACTVTRSMNSSSDGVTPQRTTFETASAAVAAES